MMKTPIICQLCDFAPVVPGSFVDSILYLSRQCREQLGIDTLFIFPDVARERFWIRRFEEQQFRYVFVPRKRHIVFNVRKHLKDYNPLIFHTHFFRFDLSAIFLKLMYYRHSQVVWHYHSRQTNKLWDRIKDNIKIGIIGRWLTGRSIAVGDAVHACLADAGMPSEKIVLAYNGIDVTRFKSDSASRKHVRQLLGISENSTTFLLLGRNPEIKGLDIFVKAAMKATSLGRFDGVFLIVGKEETKKAVSVLSRRTDFPQAVRVIEPFKDFASLLNGVDVFVSSSRTEGAPYSILEAMAGKKVVISSEIPIPIVRGPYGRSKGVLVYPTEDWEALCELMEKCMEIGKNKRDFLGLENYEHVKKFYSLETWGDQIKEVYNSLMDKVIPSLHSDV